MKRYAIGLLSAAAILVLAGCSQDDLKKAGEDAAKQAIQGIINEQPKSEVLAKKYLVILQNMNDLGCNDVAVQSAANHMGLLEGNNTVVYASDPNADANCTDFINRSDNGNCFTRNAGDKIKDLGDKIKEYAGDDKACLIATDKFDVGQAESVEAVVAKPESGDTRYLLLVNNINPDLCGAPVIYPLADSEGYKNVSFYGTEKVLTCDDSSLQGDGSFTVDCKVYDIKGHEENYKDSEGNTSCIVGTDTKPEKK